jgi:hypothetical protein
VSADESFAKVRQCYPRYPSQQVLVEEMYSLVYSAVDSVDKGELILSDIDGADEQ